MNSSVKRHFFIRDSSMLFWRLGAMSSQKQRHMGRQDTNQPPESRGIWCFPYPHIDFFFCYHQYEARLPKKFRHVIGEERAYPDFDSMTDEEAESWHKEKEEALKKIKKILRPKKFWYSGRFYSRINFIGQMYYDRWFEWDSAKDWAIVANKKLTHMEKYGNNLYQFKYAKDHLEIFIPNFK